MLRRRILGGFFKFKSDPDVLNYSYGIQKTLTNEDWLYELGTINGSYSTVTKNGKTYWKLEGRGSGCKSGYTSTSCSYNGSVGCTNCNAGKSNSVCNCNSKLFTPHCDCHQYCPCENYIIPLVEE